MGYKEIPFVRLYARKISIYLTKLLLLAHFSANQVTLLNLLLGLVIGLVFIIGKGTPIVMFIGALGLHLWIILDHCDGEVARYRKETSITGEYFDYILHYILHPYFVFCISYSTARILNHNFLVYCGIFLGFNLILKDVIDYYRLFLPKTKALNIIRNPNPEFNNFSPSEKIYSKTLPKRNIQRKARVFSISNKIAKAIFKMSFILFIRAFIIGVTVIPLLTMIWPKMNIFSYRTNFFELYIVFLSIYAVLINALSLFINVWSYSLDSDYKKILADISGNSTSNRQI